MKFRITALTVAAAIMSSAPALAADRFGDLYLGLRVIGSYQIVEDTNGIGFMGTRERTNETDFVAGGGGVIGYRFFRVPLTRDARDCVVVALLSSLLVRPSVSVT